MVAKKYLRSLGAAWMLAFLLWLPFEDTQLWMSAALAADACVWIGMRSAAKFPRTGWRAAALGALLGAAVPLLTFALMAFKSGLHSHGFADFTARQVWWLVTAFPFSILVGGLAGALIKTIWSKLDRKKGAENIVGL